MKPIRTSKQTSNGYSLIELLVAVTIISILSAYGLPKFRRNIAQGEVDRYTQFVESGLLSLRARLSRYKRSCVLDLDEDLNPVGTWGKPIDLLEFSGVNSDGDYIRVKTERLKCCDDDVTTENIVCPEEELNGKPNYRLLALEGTRESKQVEVSTRQAKYEISTNGISTNGGTLTILIRSRSTTDPQLLTRCVELSGNGYIQSGTWNDNTDFCDSS